MRNNSPILSDDSLTMTNEVEIQSAPMTADSSSPIGTPSASKRISLPSNETDSKGFQLMTDMHNELRRKEEIIDQLKQCLEMATLRDRERDAPYGLVIISSVHLLKNSSKNQSFYSEMVNT